MADFDWKRFDVSHWWKVLSAAGIAMLVAAIAAKYPPAIFLGLGVLFLGVGEWHQHPEVTLPAQSYGLPLGTVYHTRAQHYFHRPRTGRQRIGPLPDWSLQAPAGITDRRVARRGAGMLGTSTAHDVNKSSNLSALSLSNSPS